MYTLKDDSLKYFTIEDYPWRSQVALGQFVEKSFEAYFYFTSFLFQQVIIA